MFVVTLHRSKMNSASSNQLQIKLLSGEGFIKQDQTNDGIIYLTTYRLYVLISSSSYSFTSIDCPLRLIDSIDIKDSNLNLFRKDLSSFTLRFSSTNKCNSWFTRLSDLIGQPTSLNNLFAINFRLDVANEYVHRDYLIDELKRLQLVTHPWRLTEINKNYQLSIMS